MRFSLTYFVNPEWIIILPELISLMEEEREEIRRKETEEQVAQRIEKTLKPAYTEFILSRPPNEVNPTILDVALSDKWRTLLCTEPFNEKLPEPMVEAATTQIPGFAKAWR